MRTLARMDAEIPCEADGVPVRAIVVELGAHIEPVSLAECPACGYDTLETAAIVYEVEGTVVDIERVTACERCGYEP